MKKRKWHIILIISIIVIFILIYNITSYYFDYKKDLEFKEKRTIIEGLLDKIVVDGNTLKIYWNVSES